MKARFWCLAALCSLGAQPARCQNYTLRPPQLQPYFECVERPANLGNTPLASYVPDAWAYFSYDSSEPAQVIGVGVLLGNFMSPGPMVTRGQTEHFYPGYERAAFSTRLGKVTVNDLWGGGTYTPVSWFLNGVKATVSAYGTPQTFCPPTLNPSVAIVSNIGTTANQLLARMVAAPPPDTPVTVEFDNSLGDYSDVDDEINANLTNLYYLNGSIYGDITPNSASPAVSWLAIRARSGGTVLAFGHVPVMAEPPCANDIAPASLSGAEYRSPYSQTFSVPSQPDAVISATGALPPGLTLSGGTLSGTPVVAGAFPFTLVAMPPAGGCASRTAYTLTVSGPSCAVDITSQVAISFGGLKKNLATGQWNETITFQNTGAAALAGPIDVVLNSLSAGATLVNATGFTDCFAPSGLPYVSYPSGLPAGASGTVTLTFTVSGTQPITFTPRIAAGGNQQ